MRKTRVLLLLHELSRTGAPRSALDAFNAMRDEFDVRTISPVSGLLRDEFRALGSIDILSEIAQQGQDAGKRDDPDQWTRWVWEIHEWAPDLIYINTIIAMPFVRRLPLPEVPALLHVRELHSHLVPVMKEYSDLLVNRPLRYLAVSTAVQCALVSECGIAADRISVIHVFIPESRIDSASGHPTRPADGTLVVGGCGRPGWRKGTTLWLQMAADVRRLVGTSVRFVWVGVCEWPDPTWMEGVKFRREAFLMGLSDVVEFIPSTPHALEHFSAFDIFAMTSWEDPCPRVVLENMGLGKPVVCFEGSGGAPEILGDTGITIPAFDPRAMAYAIAELAVAPHKRLSLGASARERMHANYTDRAQIPKIRRELRRLGQRA